MTHLIADHVNNHCWQSYSGSILQFLNKTHFYHFSFQLNYFLLRQSTFIVSGVNPLSTGLFKTCCLLGGGGVHWTSIYFY